MDAESFPNALNTLLNDDVTPHTQDTMSATLSVKIINAAGDICLLTNITADTNISDLMKSSFLLFFKTYKQSIFKFNIVSIHTGKVLEHFKTVMENGVRDNDELLLVERYLTQDDDAMREVNEILEFAHKPGRSKLKHSANQVPSIAIINEMTKKLAVKNKKDIEYPVRSPYCNKDRTLRELYNVFLSLIEVSANIIQYADANVVFQDIVRQLRLDLKPDQVRVRHLVEKGYDVELCKIALVLKKNNFTQASNWLEAESSSITREDIAEFTSLSFDFNQINVNDGNFAFHVHNIAMYLLKKQEFHNGIDPYNISIVMSIEPGFSASEVRRALRKKFNDVNDACLFLLGELQDPVYSETKLFDMESTVGVALDKLLRNPDMLRALTDKNMLLGLLDLLEASEDSLTTCYQGDNIEALLRQIIEAFETEVNNKHGCKDILSNPAFIRD